MVDTTQSPGRSLGIRRYVLSLAAMWTVLTVALAIIGVRHEMRSARIRARNEARTHFLKNQAFRSWAASHGGAHVPSDAHTPPNPNLSPIPERDVEATPDKQRTRTNPADMMRLAMEDYEDLYGVKGHMTSLKPLRPENAPDAWERAALESFERGETEIYRLTEIDGEPHMRLTRPMLMKEVCLECHAHEGYELGDVRGGVGVSVPAGPFLAEAREYAVVVSLTLGLFWLLGMLGIGLGAQNIRLRVRERDRADATRHDHARAFMQTAIDGTPDALMVINRDYTIALANQKARDMVAGKDPVVACMKCHQVSHGSETPCEDANHPCLIDQVVATKAPATFEHIHRDSEGRQLLVEIIAAPIFDEDGEVVQIIESCHDITARERAEQTLRESEERYRRLLEHSADLICGLTIDGRITYASPITLPMTGYDPEELIGDPVTRVLTEDSARQAAQGLVRRKSGELGIEPFVQELTFRRNDGSEFVGEFHSTPIVAADGTIVGIQGIVRDITERKQAEHQRAIHVRFLENMAQIDRAIQRATDAEQMMSDVLQVTLDLFETDRAWLLYPCDPDAESWRVPMMITRPDYRHDEVMEADVAVHPEDRRIMRLALDADLPVGFGGNNEEPLPAYLTPEHGVRTLLVAPVYPRTGKPWVFGLHQCSCERQWTGEEKNLLREIGRRLGDGLSSLLFLRDLRESEERYRRVLEHSADLICGIDMDGRITYVSPIALTMAGYAPEELIGEPATRVLTQDSARQAAQSLVRRKSGELGTGPFVQELTFRRKDGSEFVGEFHSTPIMAADGTIIEIQGIARDITERKRDEEQIADSLREKEVLLREIHHRVKNNMQVIVALLRMHARRTSSDQVRDTFDECRDRINAMSLIHEALYESGDVARIDFEAYLTKLCRNLSRAHGASDKGIAITVARCNVAFGMDQAVAVGMVISELVSNAFKHAFSEEQGGSVSLSLSGLEGDELELIVQDDGKGLPPEIDIRNSPSLGLELAVAAVTDELGGSIEVERDSGTRFIIRFKSRSA